MGYLYKTEHDYFKNIDNEEKAYFLGLIYADGCIEKRRGGNRQSSLTINLQEEDGYIFDNFKITNRKCLIIKPPCEKPHWKSLLHFRVISNTIVEDLLKIGVNFNKSQIGMRFPVLREDLYNHFIRGFLDGDGCIYLKKRNYKYIRKKSFKLKKPHKNEYMLKIAFTSTDKQFLLDLFNKLNIEKYYMRTVIRKMEVNTMWIERKEEVKKVIDFLYKDATIFFKRKWEKVEEYNMIIKSQAESVLSEGLTTT